jgi:hypothetical protein
MEEIVYKYCSFGIKKDRLEALRSINGAKIEMG